LEKILDIIDSIAYEKGLQPKEVEEALKEAILRTIKSTFDPNLRYDVIIEDRSKNIKIFQVVKVLSDEDPELSDKYNYISLSEAKKIDGDIVVGDDLKYELSLDNMGRGAVNNLYKNIEFQIQRLLENNLFQKFISQKGKIVSGSVVRVDSYGNTYIELDEIRAILPLKNRIKGEEFKVGAVVKSILKQVAFDKKNGIQIELSRTTPKFLEELLRLEVPEINDGEVEIVKCARIPGERAKIALLSHSPKVDPVGSTVGVKGVRINAVSRELKNENIDCIEYSEVPEIFISRAMSPAMISSVKIEEGVAKIVIPSGEKAKAIGKKGTNIKLASMLSGFEIEVNEKEGAQNKQAQTENGEGNAEINDKKDISSLASLFKE